MDFIDKGKDLAAKHEDEVQAGIDKPADPVHRSVDMTWIGAGKGGPMPGGVPEETERRARLVLTELPGRAPISS